MILELSLIALSAIVMAALLIHKGMEVSRGVETKIVEVRQKTDPILKDLHHTTGRFFSYFTIHNAILLVNYIFVAVIRFFMNVSKKVHDASSTFVAKASKKKEDLSRGGAASFYLKKIKEGKETGEINETLE